MNRIFAGPIFTGVDIAVIALQIIFVLAAPFAIYYLVSYYKRNRKGKQRTKAKWALGLATVCCLPFVTLAVWLVLLLPLQEKNDQERHINEYVESLPVLFLPKDAGFETVSFQGISIGQTPSYLLTYDLLSVEGHHNSTTLQQHFGPDKDGNCDILGAETATIITAEPTKPMPCQTETLANSVVLYSSVGQYEYYGTYTRMAFVADNLTFFSTITTTPEEQAAFKVFAQNLRRVDDVKIVQYITDNEKWSKEFK